MTATKTQISWTDKCWNPIRGCARVSAGCEHCYAERMAGRFSGPGQPYEGLVQKTSQGYKWTGDVRLIAKDLEAPLRWKTPCKVFVASMSDPFHPAVPDAYLAKMFAVMLEAPHIFQLLTKRPERMSQFVTRWLAPGLSPRALEHIWLGVSVEDQATADERIPWLLRTPALVRFVSYEPALEGVNFCSLDGGDGYRYSALSRGTPFGHHQYDAKIDWVIVGGESGPKARPFDLRWAHHVVQECGATETAVWVKQLGARAHLRTPFTFHTHYPTTDRAGADPEEWPMPLRVQQFPMEGDHAAR